MMKIATFSIEVLDEQSMKSKVLVEQSTAPSADQTCLSPSINISQDKDQQIVAAGTRRFVLLPPFIAGNGSRHLFSGHLGSMKSRFVQRVRKAVRNRVGQRPEVDRSTRSKRLRIMQRKHQ